MLLVLITIFGCVFALLAWKNLPLATALFLFLLPTYLIRFSVGSIPTTLLEMMLLLILGVGLTQKKIGSAIYENAKENARKNKLLFFGTLLFLIGASVSIFSATDLKSALGEWKAFYVEPILFFLVVSTIVRKKNNLHLLLSGLLLSGLVVALLATYQHFTGFLVPYDFWQNRDTFRVTGWYGFPNAVGLFLAPIVPLALYLGIEQYRLPKKRKAGTIYYLLFAACLLILCSRLRFSLPNPPAP